MSRIKSFSALLLVLCVFLSLLTSCDKTAAGETTATDTSAETTTAPETTARELHEPNVRQLSPSSAYKSIFNLMPENYTLPDIIKSVGQYREFVENCVNFKGDAPLNFDGEYSYGFPLTPVEITHADGRVETRYEISKDDFIGIYDEEFFLEHVIIIRQSITSDISTCISSVIAMRGNNEFMVFSLGFSPPEPSLMERYMIMKFVELDRDFLTGKKIVYELAPYYQMEWWDIFHTAQPQTHAEGYALLLETYGDEFYYIEPWVLKPES